MTWLKGVESCFLLLFMGEFAVYSVYFCSELMEKEAKLGGRGWMDVNVS